MKQKILYVSFAALIIIIFISVLIGREITKTRPASEEINPQETATQQPDTFSGYAQQPQSPYASDSSHAITFIKPSPDEKPVSAAKETEKKIKKSRQLEPPPDQSPVVSEEDPAEPASGVTKIGKHPTEIENKEMNARGIIMY